MPKSRSSAVWLLALVLTAAPAMAQPQAPPEWIQKSNANSQVLLSLFASLSPESAGQMGVAGLDEEITDLTSGIYERQMKAGETAAAELRTRLAAEQDPRVKQDIEILLDTPDRTDYVVSAYADMRVKDGFHNFVDVEMRNLARAADGALSEAEARKALDANVAAIRRAFDSADTSARGLLTFQFFVDAWRRLGIDVEISATNYNQFQEKVRNGAYQIFQWGWVADYPDPENFFFLLWSEMARSKSGGPNTANFADPRFDALFLAMKARENDAERLRIVGELRALLEEERPWIELVHPEDYALYHGWLRNVKPTGMSYPTVKYRDLDAARRAELRAAWNEPVRWPAFALAALGVAIVVPGVRTFLRERQ